MRVRWQHLRPVGISRVGAMGVVGTFILGALWAPVAHAQPPTVAPTRSVVLPQANLPPRPSPSVHAPSPRTAAPSHASVVRNGDAGPRSRALVFVPQRRNVTNESLQDHVAREKDVLEIVVPANKGHVYFRVGEKVYDFFTDGLRIGPVRAIGSERYGFLVRLSPADLGRLRGHLDRLERTNGAELGAYDFEGERGFHCVSWLARLSIGPRGENLVDLLGGAAKDGESMPAFARFVAGRVPEQVVYSSAPIAKPMLDAMPLRLMSLAELEAAFATNPAAVAAPRPATTAH